MGVKIPFFFLSFFLPLAFISNAKPLLFAEVLSNLRGCDLKLQPLLSRGGCRRGKAFHPALLSPARVVLLGREESPKTPS